MMQLHNDTVQGDLNDASDLLNPIDVCKKRAEAGFKSGMGKIFIDIAALNPIIDIQWLLNNQ